MTAEKLKMICHPQQFTAIHELYYHTPSRGGPVDRVDHTLDKMASLVDAVDLDTVGAMLVLLNAARKEDNNPACASGIMTLVRLLKRNGFSFEDCLLLTAAVFVSSDSAAMDRAISTTLAISVGAATVSNEKEEVPGKKMNGTGTPARSQ